MQDRRIAFAGALVLLLFVAGCEERTVAPGGTLSPAPDSSTTTVAARDVVARVYWVGKQKLRVDTNATYLMSLWDLPESEQLEGQTLDKLALAASGWGGARSDLDIQADLRRMLRDVVNAPSYTELGSDGRDTELAFAVKLDDERANDWQTNLASAVRILTGIDPVPAAGNRPGWTVRTADSNLIEFARAGDWVVLGAGKRANGRLRVFLDRIVSTGTPYEGRAPEYWVEAELDLRHVMPLATRSRLAPGAPRVIMRVTGDSEYVRARGSLLFPQDLKLNLDPWTVPTNLIHGDLRSFVAVRGLAPHAESYPGWTRLQLGSPPNQVFSWALPGKPPQIHFAAPWTGATNRVDRISAWILREFNPLMATNVEAGFEMATAFHGVRWNGVPYLYPFVRADAQTGMEMITGGSVLVDGDTSAPNWDAIEGLYAQTNQVYYEREFTGGQIEQWHFISQFARFVFDRAQLSSESVGFRWLAVLMPRVGSSGTDVVQAGPRELTFSRTAGIGLTAFELNLLVDWLESPTFPGGLLSFVPRAATADTNTMGARWR